MGSGRSRKSKCKSKGVTMMEGNIKELILIETPDKRGGTVQARSDSIGNGFGQS